MKGIGVSQGIAIGRAWVLRPKRGHASGQLLPDEAAVEREIEIYRVAVSEAVSKLEAMIERAVKAEAEILGIQVELLLDPQMEEAVIGMIREDRMAARDAILKVTEQLMQVFTNMKDEYMRARAADIQDVGNRVVRVLDGEDVAIQMEDGEWIVIAEDLSPSETVGLDAERVCGFVTQNGGVTSHAAIVARLRGLPAVAACSGVLSAAADRDIVVLDGVTGDVLFNPTVGELQVYREKKKAFAERLRVLEELRDRPAVTTDGVRIQLLANIATAEDMEQALEQGAEGVGLLRTELLFMDRDSLPSEEEQLEFYKRVLLRSGGLPVTIRTLDIGGDKPLPYLGLPEEANPFLGYRAIRICLDRVDIFMTQLRAILRASVFGKSRVMFPMIGSLDELLRAKAVLAEAQRELRAAGIVFDEEIPVGIMIEVPSAALTADLLAPECDFFSIGTNDLTQYVLAVDRMNVKIAALYDSYHPAVLRLVLEVIEQGLRQGIPVGMCGELAGDPRATELLLGMGLRQFSMSANSIPVVKEVILRSKAI
jgi:phosphoenolpyruvate-protein phosphotransferase (PTS system enzyme I)